MRFISSTCAAALAIALATAGAVEAHAQDAQIKASGEPALPEPEANPLKIDFSGDPVLALAEATAEKDTFRKIVVAALDDSPVNRETLALENAARARVGEARGAFLPTIDVGVSAFRTLERSFGNDPFNLIERSRPRERIDFSFSIAQPLVDATSDGRVAAAADQLRAAGFEREARAGEAAGQMLSAWTQVFGYQALERLLEGFVSAQEGLEAGIDTRIERGVSAEGDRVRVASLRSQAQVQLAQVRRQRASAEARFEELSGFEPPEGLLRPPMLDATRFTREYAIFAAQSAPRVEAAEAVAQAREHEADSADGAKFPRVTARVDHGRYGVFEIGPVDYDTRATLDVSWRILGGGVWSRARAARADALAADAVADRIRDEARREAVIAWSDVQAIEQQVVALEEAYKSARQSRDIVVARFGALRGTLFDVADAQNAYLTAASSYIRALTELDQARFILLLRTGRLLDVLEIDNNEVPQ